MSIICTVFLYILICTSLLLSVLHCYHVYNIVIICTAFLIPVCHRYCVYIFIIVCTSWLLSVFHFKFFYYLCFVFFIFTLLLNALLTVSVILRDLSLLDVGMWLSSNLKCNGKVWMCHCLVLKTSLQYCLLYLGHLGTRMNCQTMLPMPLLCVSVKRLLTIISVLYQMICDSLVLNPHCNVFCMNFLMCLN